MHTTTQMMNTFFDMMRTRFVRQPQGALAVVGEVNWQIEMLRMGCECTTDWTPVVLHTAAAGALPPSPTTCSGKRPIGSSLQPLQNIILSLMVIKRRLRNNIEAAVSFPKSSPVFTVQTRRCSNGTTWQDNMTLKGTKYGQWRGRTRSTVPSARPIVQQEGIIARAWPLEHTRA